MHSPSYLYRKKYSYGVRLRVPADLASWFNGRAEIKLSLHTTNPKKAAERSRMVIGHLQFMFRNIRGGGILAELTAEEMDGLVKAHVAELLKDNIDLWLRSKPLKDDEEVEHQALFFKDLNIQAHDQMIRRDYEGRFNGSDGRVNACKDVDSMLARAGLEISPSSPEYSQLCLRMLKGLSDLYGELEDKVSNGILPLDGNDNGPANIQTNGQRQPPGATVAPLIGGNGNSNGGGHQGGGTVSLQQAAQVYWDERVGDWKPRSMANYRSAFNYLLENFGPDTPVDQLNFYMMKEYRDKLRREKGLSASRVNFHMRFAKAVFGHEMITTRTIHMNPASGLTLKDNRRRQDVRDAFDDDDLRKLFVESKQYGRDRFDKPFKFWIPLLALYTGARLEEICQLDTTDIVEVDGVWCMDINQNGPKKSVKTAEQRIVPLHPFLLELGLVRFAQKLPPGKLWKHLKHHGKSWGHYVTRWFKAFKDGAGIDPTPQKKTFHSFRHTVSTALKYKEVSERDIDELTGHVTAGEGSRYGKLFKPRQLLELTVSRLDWEKRIGLGHLRESKWAR